MPYIIQMEVRGQLAAIVSPLHHVGARDHTHVVWLGGIIFIH